MKRIFVNFKRFDVPADMGGVNRLSSMQEWATNIVGAVKNELCQYDAAEAEFTMFFPEAHLMPAIDAAKNLPLKIGCQGVYREDISPGGNFGAFTTNRPASAIKAMGCGSCIIGHCEERKSYAGVLATAGHATSSAIDTILNEEALCACNQGLQVLYCIGETSEQRENWQSVLQSQLEEGLKNLPREQIVIAYEPIWAIGPGKTPPDRAAIQTAASFIKEQTGGLPLVYGGGLKADNAAMLSAIPEIDGGLIALTRFSGEIGFYPDEYLEIVRLYLGE